MDSAQVAAPSTQERILSRIASRYTGLVITVLGLLQLVLHLLFNARYNFFRDELYYIECSKHLAAGYVDQPPLIAFSVRLSRFLFGDSLLALRLFAALSMIGLLALSVLIAREMGGRKYALWLTGLCVFFGPIWLNLGYIMTMNSYEHLIWTACAYVIVRFINTRNPRLWLWFGVLCGIGLENKYAITTFGAGVALGLLLTPERRVFLNKWIWIGAAAALAIFLPNLIWNIQHHWPFVEVMRNIKASGRDVVLSPPRFFFEQILLTLPISVFVWCAGLIWCLFSPTGKRYRVLGITFLFVVIGFLLMHGKNYYSTPIYPVMMAAGAVALEPWLGSRWRAVGCVYAALIIVTGTYVLPMVVPVLPVDAYLNYQKKWLFEPPKSEHSHEHAALPQVYADQFGWTEITGAVAQAWQRIPEAERKDCVVFGQDYGVASAINFYGPKYGLPPAISGHQNYWIWGPRGYSGNCMIVVDDHRARLEELFEDVQYVTTSAPNAYGLETELSVWICRRAKFGSLEKVWPMLKRWG
jgi:MFS family permease